MIAEDQYDAMVANRNARNNVLDTPWDTQARDDAAAAKKELDRINELLKREEQ